MSESDSSSLSNSNSDSGEGFAENITLKPYDMEPTRSSPDLSSSSSSDNGDEIVEIERTNNTNWCKCGGFCRAMKTNCESLCCRDTNEIPDEYFKATVKSFCMIF